MRTYYCSYCSLWSQRDFCNRLERSRTCEPFILLSSPAWKFIRSKIVTSASAGMGKSFWVRNRTYFLYCTGASWELTKLQCSLNPVWSGHIHFIILVWIMSVLLKETCWSFPLSPLQWASWSSLGAVSQAPSRRNQSRGCTLTTVCQSWGQGQRRNPWNAYWEVVSSSFFTLWIWSYCTGRVCATTLAWTWAWPRDSQFSVLVWVSGLASCEVCVSPWGPIRWQKFIRGSQLARALVAQGRFSPFCRHLHSPSVALGTLWHPLP